MPAKKKHKHKEARTGERAQHAQRTRGQHLMNLRWRSINANEPVALPQVGSTNIAACDMWRSTLLRVASFCWRGMLFALAQRLAQHCPSDIPKYR